ncbi:hypothetical protein LXL04_039742 [Taraxacum kok-saghyz]
MGDPLGSPRVAPLFFADRRPRFKHEVRTFYEYFKSWPLRHEPRHFSAIRDRLGPRNCVLLFCIALDRRFDDPLQRGWTDDYGLVRHKRNKHGLYFGCDHTSTNAPDPIRTPQLSVLGRE